LAELDCGIAAFVKVLLIRNAAFVGVEMAPMKHQIDPSNVCFINAFERVDVEISFQARGNIAELSKVRPFPFGAPLRRHQHVTAKLTGIVATEGIEGINGVLQSAAGLASSI
jgi:hypothetical protein